MADEALVSAVKSIVSLAKAGKSDEAYAAYAKLFASREFGTYAPADQRQALKLMVHAKGIPQIPPKSVIDAHRAAIPALRALTAAHGEPADYEMLGMCEAMIGDENAARVTFQKGLDLERARNPQSPLCGQLMKRVASV